MTLRQALKSLTLSLLILQTGVLAQLPQVRQEADAEKAAARRELERKALLLLDETIQGAQVLKLPENRAAVRTQAADLLWTRDEKRARALFHDAAADLASARPDEGARRDRFYWMPTQLRGQLVYTAAARDAQLALELLRESRPPASDEDAGGPVSADPNQELRFEQSIAALAAESDPKAALRMAEESLSKGVSYGVLDALQRLRRKDPESATKLAGEIVAKLRGQSLSGGREAFSVALSLLQAAVLPQQQQQEQFFYGASASLRPAEKPKPLALEESDLRDLAELVAGAALKDSAANGAYGLMTGVRPLLPEIEKRVPARAAQLRQRMAEVDKALDPSERIWTRYDSLIKGPAGAMLEEAAKVPEEMRPAFYSAAAMKLWRDGQTEKARQVVAENLRGQEREQLTAMFDQAEVMQAVEKGDTDAARAVVSRIKSKEGRARALSELAAALASKGDRKGAGQLLEEARALLDRQPGNEKEVEALLEVARGYTLVEPAKTFELIDPLVDQANDMLTAAALLEKFGQGAGLFRKGEMIMAPTLSAAGLSYARYIKALGELARVDFDRARTTADRFNRDEVRLMARLVLARSVLSDRLDAPADPRGGLDLGGGFMLSN